MKRIFLGGILACVVLAGARAGFGAETLLLEDEGFQEKVQSLSSERNDREKLRQARSLITRHRLSSLQVKTICARLNDDAARFDFALAAYPRTVDPENFYEVYDAFTTFSKVMRLHDQVRSQSGPVPWPAPVVVAEPAVLGEEDIRTIVQSLRKESFDNTRLQIARQIVTASERKFLSSHIKRMVECFDFEPPRLELAKFAYDYTFDREKYFLVNDAFSFTSTKEALSRYLETRVPKPPKH